jgi:hypothetical protein
MTKPTDHQAAREARERRAMLARAADRRASAQLRQLAGLSARVAVVAYIGSPR